MTIKTMSYINFELMNIKIVKSTAILLVTNNFSTLILERISGHLIKKLDNSPLAKGPPPVIPVPE